MKQKVKKAPTSLFGLQLKANPEAHKLSVALNMVGLQTNIQGCELIMRAQEAVKKMGNKFDLKTACSIIAEVNEKYEAIEENFNKTKPNN